MEPHLAGGGGRGRGNRGGRTRRKNTNKGGTAHKKSVVPPPPQLKLVLRHISNPTIYGTTKAVLEELLIPLITSCNLKATNSVLTGTPPGTMKGSTVTTASSVFFLEIDSTAKRHLIDEEEATQKYLRDWERKQVMEGTDTAPTNDGGIPGDDIETGKNGSDDMESEPENTKIDVLVAPAPKAPPGVPVISLRPLYVVPPKRSRRRGDRPGVAYILLTAPKIEKVEIPETVPENAVPSVVSQPKKRMAATAGAAKNPGQASHPIEAAEGSEVFADVSSADSSTGKNSSVSSFKKHPVYARQVAQGRLLLRHATDLLREMAATTHLSKTEIGKDPWGTDIGITDSLEIEPAMSGKSWRWQNVRSDRRENTLETTGDFKNWFAGLEKQEADLKARPKPAPGGGLPTTEEGGNAATAAQPIAALVKHLLSKQQDMKRKNTKKKKEGVGIGAVAKEGKVKGGKAGAKNSSKQTKPGPKQKASASSRRTKGQRRKPVLVEA